MKWLMLAALVLVVAACGEIPQESAPGVVRPTTPEAEISPDPTLLAARWRVVETSRQNRHAAVPADVQAWIQFYDASVVAFAGCNTIVASVKYGKGSLRFSEAKIPAPIPCPSAVNDLQQVLMGVLEGGRAVYTRAGPTMRVDVHGYGLSLLSE